MFIFWITICTTVALLSLFGVQYPLRRWFGQFPYCRHLAAFVCGLYREHDIMSNSNYLSLENSSTMFNLCSGSFFVKQSNVKSSTCMIMVYLLSFAIGNDSNGSIQKILSHSLSFLLSVHDIICCHPVECFQYECLTCHVQV